MNNIKTFIITTVIALLILIGGTFIIYKVSFAPKEEFILISEIQPVNEKFLFNKFLPNNINLSLKEITVESSTSFTEEEPTNLFGNALNESPESLEYIKGIKVRISEDLIKVIALIDYNGIPLQGTLNFTCRSDEGKGIITYSGGKLGFINISKDSIFELLQENSIISLNKEKGEIILSFDSIKQLDVKEMQISHNKLNIIFRGTLRLFDF